MTSRKAEAPLPPHGVLLRVHIYFYVFSQHTHFSYATHCCLWLLIFQCSPGMSASPCENTHTHTFTHPSHRLPCSNTSSAPLPPLSAPSLRLDVERDGVNTTVCVFPFNSGMHNDKKIVTTFGTVILFGCVLYSW